MTQRASVLLLTATLFFVAGLGISNATTVTLPMADSGDRLYPRDSTKVKRLGSSTSAASIAPETTYRAPARVRRIGAHPSAAAAATAQEPRRGGVLTGRGYVLGVTDYLFGMAGVRVYGNGPTSQVLIRGRCPFYIVDGLPIGFDYREVHGLVPPSQIESVEVIRGFKAWMLYGQGAGGAIAITTKR